MKLSIIYEDEYLVVVEKLAGVPVQSARVGTKDMVSILKNYLCGEELQGREPYVGVIHRLDQPVEGILVFAKTPFAAKELSRQIANQQMKKTYLAILCGVPDPEESILENYLVKDGRNNISRVVSTKGKDAKLARLSYKVLNRVDDETLVEIELFTGRHHQIRVQMANAKLPILGDLKYNVEESQKELAGKGLALCAYQLEFEHPKTKKRMSFEVKPKGEVFQKLIK